MIWCVDDDSAIRDIEVYALTSTGLEARGFADGASMTEALKDEVPELIILDIMMPGEDGFSILSGLRGDPKTARIPVIMATAKGSEIDKIQCLDAGADDYLVKPFGVLEMVSRVKAVLRRCAPPEEETGTLRAGSVTLDPDSHTVTVEGEKVSLTVKEFDLLRLFMENPGKVFSREKLLSRVWGTDYMGESRTVDMHITTLRRKLGSAGRLIGTVIGVGYRMETPNG